MITSYMLRNRPDQTVGEINRIIRTLKNMESSITVISNDRKYAIIIGEDQPINPNTGKPYPFGIYKYRISGSKLILEEDYNV